MIKSAFDAVELERLPTPGGYHIEARIGDSMVVLEVGKIPPHANPTLASIYVYVADVDRAYKRALAAGATSVAEPEGKQYQERSAGVKDSFGNIWYIATYVA
jgi:PhnB protein